MRPGPSSVPNAAISFTSPAPVAPMTWPGSISTRPSARPAAALDSPTVVGWNAASIRPRTAMPKVITLGTRRSRRSIAAVVLPPTATAPKATASKVLNNGLPQHAVDLVTERGHAGHHHDGDQHSQESVLEQVLPFFVASQACNRC